MAKGKVVELPVPQFPHCWKQIVAFIPSKGSGTISYTCNTNGSYLWRKGNADSAVSAERIFYSQFVLKNAACKEVLLIIPKNQQHTPNSKSLFHMLFLFSWLFPNIGHYLLPHTPLLLSDTASLFPTQNACARAASFEGSNPRETECPYGSWGHSDIHESSFQLKESDSMLLFLCKQPC